MKMTPAEMSAKAAELKPAWARDYIRQLEELTRDLAGRLRDANGQPAEAKAADEPASRDLAAVAELHEHPEGTHSHPHTRPDHDHVIVNGEIREAGPGHIPGITPPGGEYAVVRVLDGAASMKPLADLPDRAEIRFSDYYQVRFGDHDLTAGARVLIIETDGPLIIRPVDPGTVIIARG